MAVATIVFSAPSSGAVENTCRATNVTQGTPSRSNLQAAINAAHPGDRIAVRGVCFGGFKIDKNLTLAGRQSPEGAKPVLHGEHGSGRVVDVAARVTLASLTVTGGLARAGENLRDQKGGGIIVRKGAVLTVDRSVVRGNKATDQGGGIANYGTLILTGSTSVSENVVGHGYEDGSRDGHGGGIVNYGTLRMNDSSSVRNNEGGNTGGGIRNYATLIMNGSSSVRANTAELGGGIFSNTDRPRYKDATVTMNDASSVRGNIAVRHDDGTNGVGGGIAVWNGALTMNDSSSVRGNSAPGAGGIWNYFSSVVMNDLSAVRGNSAGDGGGIDNLGGALTMSGSSSVGGNTADRGGGIKNDGDITLKDSASVFDNTTTSTGGGIHNNGTVTACDGTSIDEWIGTVEPNDPNDFLDSDVTLISSGTGGCG